MLFGVFRWLLTIGEERGFILAFSLVVRAQTLDRPAVSCSSTIRTNLIGEIVDKIFEYATGNPKLLPLTYLK